MLTIRKEQMNVFADARRQKFINNLAEHFLKFYPRECRQAGGPSQIEKLVRHGIDRAAVDSYETERQVSLFIALQFMLGGEFDHDAQLPFASAVIADKSALPDATSRIEGVYDDALDYLGDVAGENSGYIVRAMVRVRDWDPATAPQTTGEPWLGDMVQLLSKLYPQKYALQGLQPTLETLNLARQRCEKYQITGSRGQAIYAILMFFLGSGFDRDLLHPWANEVLTSAASDETARVSQLYDAAMKHMSESFESD